MFFSTNLVKVCEVWLVKKLYASLILNLRMLLLYYVMEGVYVMSQKKQFLAFAAGEAQGQMNRVA